MCGIIALVQKTNVIPSLMTGLFSLEYRGYDSSGISFQVAGSTKIIKSVGKIENLKKKIEPLNLSSHIGIAHTRWATHGGVTEENAHPHTSGKVSLVHNGIIENYAELKQELIKEGYTFYSQTDTEVLAKVIDKFLKTNTPLQALKETIATIHGTFSVVVMIEGDENSLYVMKNGSPMVVGISDDNGNFVASDPAALINLTDKFIFLNDNEIAEIKTDSVNIYDFTLKKLLKEPTQLSISKNDIAKEGFDYFMEKEIFEQPHLLSHCIEKLVSSSEFAPLYPINIDFIKIKKIIMTACGSSYHACMVGKLLLENKISTPIQIEFSSELRYKNLHISDDTLIICASQSGETADLLLALKDAKERGATILSILNRDNSSIEMISDFTLPISAGVEIGVASTKAFTSQLVVFYYLAELFSSRPDFEKLVKNVKKITTNILTLFAKKDDFIDIASSLTDFNSFIYLGRNITYPIALEGALKMKEITYRAADCHPSGELKHGHIALIDEHTPVVFLVPKDKLLEKNLSNMQEVLARNGKVILIGSADVLEKHSSTVFRAIEVVDDNELYPIIYTISLQMLAFYTARSLGRDIDKPRNLAKSVTVE